MTEKTKGADEKYCQTCGEIINVKAEICPKCGVRQIPSGSLGGISNRRLAAAIFAIFLGAFGVHKFYLGKIGQGILYLVFFWTVIPAIVGFVEGIIYLTMNEETFNSKYGSG